MYFLSLTNFTTLLAQSYFSNLYFHGTFKPQAYNKLKLIKKLLFKVTNTFMIHPSPFHLSRYLVPPLHIYYYYILKSKVTFRMTIFFLLKSYFSKLNLLLRYFQALEPFLPSHIANTIHSQILGPIHLLNFCSFPVKSYFSK